MSSYIHDSDTEERAARAGLSYFAATDDEPSHREITRFGAAAVLGRLPVPAGVETGSWHSDPIAFGHELLERAHRDGVEVLIPGDARWPVLGMGGPRPACLWTRGPGQLADMLARSVAVTGCRAASAYGEHVAGTVAYELATAGITVATLSGYGIPAAAIRSAIVARIPHVLVLGGGHQYVFPQAFRSLWERIARDGVLVSPFPPGLPPARRRIRYAECLLQAITTATVVVEAGANSSTAGAARTAHGGGARILAVPGPVTSGRSAGCHALIRDGMATLVTGLSDIVAQLPTTEPSDAVTAQ